MTIHGRLDPAKAWRYNEIIRYRFGRGLPAGLPLMTGQPNAFELGDIICTTGNHLIVTRYPRVTE